MTKEINVNDLLLIHGEVEKLYKQDKCFKVNTAFKILKLYKDIDEANSYILNRLREVIPSIVNPGYKLTDEERVVYNTILLSPIEIDNHGLTVDDIISDNNAEMTVQGLENLLKLL